MRDMIFILDIFSAWHAVPTDRSLDSVSVGSSRGGSTPGPATKNVSWMLYVSQIQSRRAEPEKWQSPNQKCSITIPNAERRMLKKHFRMNFIKVRP